MLDSEARRIAADWHGGQWSPLYAYASSGHLSVAALGEAGQQFRVALRCNGYREDSVAVREIAALVAHLRREITEETDD